jgi:hypothetical protein
MIMFTFRPIYPSEANLLEPVQEKAELAGSGRFGKDKIFWAHLELNYYS